MAEGGMDLGVLAGMGNSAMSLVVLIVAIGIIVAVVVAIVLAILSSKKYKQFIVVIWQKDGFGQFMQKRDEGGIFVDRKTGNKRLFLKNAQVGLDPDNIPYIPTSKGSKYIYLLQTGLKNYRYLKPNIDQSFINFTVGEEDVNWATNSYEAVKKRFSSNWLMQYLPFIILAFTCMIMLIMFIYIFNKLPAIKEIAIEMNNVVKNLAALKSGTTIISP